MRLKLLVKPKNATFENIMQMFKHKPIVKLLLNVIKEMYYLKNNTHSFKFEGVKNIEHIINVNKILNENNKMGK